MATRTSWSLNINSHYFNHFLTLSPFLKWQGCGSSSKGTLVGTAFILGEKMKIYPQVLTFFIKPQIWLFPVVVLLTTAKTWKNAHAGRAKLLFLPTKYANLWHSHCHHCCRFLSSLLKKNKIKSLGTYQSIIEVIVLIKQRVVSCGSIQIDPTWAKRWHETCEQHTNESI